MTNTYIMALPRSGSTFLYRMMAQSPDVAHLYYEPFNYTEIAQDYHKTDIYNRCATVMEEIKHCADGILVKDTLTYVHDIQTDERYRQLFENFQTYINDNFYRVKLYRRDIFEQSISNCIATLTDKWSRKSTDTKFDVVTIQVSHLKYILDINKQMRDFLVNYPHYDKIIYLS